RGLVVKGVGEPLASRLVLSALDAAVADTVEPLQASRGKLVVSNTKSFRMRADVPLLIPEVNADHLALLGDLVLAPAITGGLEGAVPDIRDSALKAPRDGRVQYKVAQVGEVVGAGGRVLSLVDLSDVYMTFFLPTAAAGKVALGTEVRLVLDAAPRYVIPARVSFVSDVAQFTPKTVETASEREKLMFRVRAQIPVELLKKHITRVKTGLPGMAYVRLDTATPWPERLTTGLVQ
ncbi:MAG TPA: HlyD family efflux transporter periplasmic adaptor subunit, partial [Geobacter anodireducens]|nr:HlyD family efflux transporter periplasmic adaptor subunit [Geobacter anodireducens]